MNYGKYHLSVSGFDQENYEKIIRDSRRFPEISQESGKAEFRKEAYFLKSKIRAVQSRAEFQNLSPQEEIALRIYGRFALILNRIIRNNQGRKTLVRNDDLKTRMQNLAHKYIVNRNFNTYKDVSVIDKNDFENSLRLQNDYPAMFLTNFIDELISKNRSEHVDTNYFYRMSRAKKNVYVTEADAVELSLDINTTIQLGNIVIDKAITSVGNDLQSILYRYSAEGNAATHKKGVDNVNEEEILYVIKNNDSLDYMDISGFKLKRPEINSDGKFAREANNKLLKGQDEYSSGELIIPSHTPFRVIGVQRRENNIGRKVVFLEPMLLSDINQNMDIVQNNFNGERFSRNGAFDLAEVAF